MRGLAVLAGAAAAMLPAAAHAQAYACSIPATLPQPRPELPNRSEPRRVLPIGGYTLAVRWAPQYCHANARDRDAKFECGSGNRFGFTLHGLWPDGVGKDWPQYCAATPLLPSATIKGMMCKTPSAQLIQHEWAKHGTCTGLTAAGYFGMPVDGDPLLPGPGARLAPTRLADWLAARAA